MTVSVPPAVDSAAVARSIAVGDGQVLNRELDVIVHGEDAHAVPAADRDRLPPSMVVSALMVLVLVTVIWRRRPQSKVTRRRPPPAAASSAASVQLAGVPVPTTPAAKSPAVPQGQRVPAAPPGQPAQAATPRIRSAVRWCQRPSSDSMCHGAPPVARRRQPSFPHRKPDAAPPPPNLLSVHQPRRTDGLGTARRTGTRRPSVVAPVGRDSGGLDEWEWMGVKVAAGRTLRRRGAGLPVNPSFSAPSSPLSPLSRRTHRHRQ